MYAHIGSKVPKRLFCRETHAQQADIGIEIEVSDLRQLIHEVGSLHAAIKSGNSLTITTIDKVIHREEVIIQSQAYAADCRQHDITLARNKGGIHIVSQV